MRPYHRLPTDNELVHRILAGYRPAVKYGTYMWARVKEEFGLGSMYAKELCLRHGFNPDLKVWRTNR